MTIPQPGLANDGIAKSTRQKKVVKARMFTPQRSSSCAGGKISQRPNVTKANYGLALNFFPEVENHNTQTASDAKVQALP